MTRMCLLKDVWKKWSCVVHVVVAGNCFCANHPDPGNTIEMKSHRRGVQQASSGLKCTSMVDKSLITSVGAVIMKTVTMAYLMVSLASSQMHREVAVTCNATVSSESGSASIVCDYNVTFTSLQHLHLVVEFHEREGGPWVHVAKCDDDLASCYSNVTGYSFVKGEGEGEMVLNISPLPDNLSGSYVCTLKSAHHIGASQPCSLEDRCQLMEPLQASEQPRYLKTPDPARGSRCSWLITSFAPIQLTNVFFSPTPDPNTICQPWLSVHDGSSETSPVLMDSCDKTLKNGSVVVSYSNQVVVKFLPRSGWPAQVRDFSLRYQTLAENDSTWEYNKTVSLASHEMRNISSRYFPYSYPRNTDFYWLVVAPKHHKVQLDVVVFDLQGLCQESFVKLYDGNSSDSTLMARLCGQGASTRYVSATEALYISFRSGLHRSLGFKFQLTSVSRDLAIPSQTDTTAAIVGGVVGGIVLLVVLVVIIVVVITVRNRQSSQSASRSNSWKAQCVS